MTPPREPFFKPEDSDCCERDPDTTIVEPCIQIKKANRLVEPLLEENERLKICLFQMQNAAQDLVRQLAALKAEIEQAPVVYVAKGYGHYDSWTQDETDLDGRATHKARLVRIEEIGK